MFDCGSVSIREVLRRTEGWLDLGCPNEACEELEFLPDGLHATREVLKLKCRAFHLAGNWSELGALSSTAARYFPKEAAFPEFWAWSEHKQGRTTNAYTILVELNPGFLQSWRSAYYLACFSYKLNRVQEATMWLGRALLCHPSPEQLQKQAAAEASLDLPPQGA